MRTAPLSCRACSRRRSRSSSRRHSTANACSASRPAASRTVRLPGATFFSNDTIVELSTAINTRLRQLDDTLSPPVLTVEHVAPDDADAPGGPTLGDLGLIVLPGIIFMSILFIGHGLSGDVWEEKRFGTLHRAVSAPPSMSAFLAGKLLAGAGLVGAAALVGVAVGAVFFDLPLAHAPLAIVWTTFAGMALVVYFVLLQLVASSQRAGTVLTTLVLFPTMMLGGSFSFPSRRCPPGWRPSGAGRRTGSRSFA